MIPSASRADHAGRTSQLATEFDRAQDAVLRRLMALSDAVATAAPADGGWSAAEVGWHVAKVNDALRGLITGERGEISEAPEGFVETWDDKPRPASIKTSEAFTPPDGVTREMAIRMVAEAREKTTLAIRNLDPQHACKVTQMRFGLLSIYQIAEFARMHTERHLGQLDRILGPE